MSEPIKVGDLVIMVRGHECLLKRKGGIPFIVTGFIPALGGGWKCGYCLQINAGADEPAAYGLVPQKVTPTGGHPAIPVSWLKKIDPPAELDDVRQDEEITA